MNLSKKLCLISLLFFQIITTCSAIKIDLKKISDVSAIKGDIIYIEQDQVTPELIYILTKNSSRFNKDIPTFHSGITEYYLYTLNLLAPQNSPPPELITDKEHVLLKKYKKKSLTKTVNHPTKPVSLVYVPEHNCRTPYDALFFVFYNYETEDGFKFHYGVGNKQVVSRVRTHLTFGKNNEPCLLWNPPHLILLSFPYLFWFETKVTH